jgi:hypothetical protein
MKREVTLFGPQPFLLKLYTDGKDIQGVAQTLPQARQRS